MEGKDIKGLLNIKNRCEIKNIFLNKIVEVYTTLI